MPTCIPVIDLFAGAGGIGVGAVMAGGDLRLSVELDPVACETLRLNKKHHPGEVLEGDVSALTGKELRERAGLKKSDPLVIVGGPPCQPFSKAAYWLDPGDDAAFRRARARGETPAVRPKPITRARPDERRTLVDEFLERIREANADGFVFENVPSITHPRNLHVLEGLLGRAKALGYKTSFVKANAVDYGVAQMRERVFILGAKRSAPAIPEKTHSSAKSDVGTRPVVTAGQALKGLNSARYAEPEEVVQGRWEREFREIPPGWNYKWLTAWNGQRPVFEAETRFWNFLLKLSPDRPSWTIAANPGPWIGPFHWDHRRLRIVEMAALQSFPAGYVFAGNRREKVRQVGNAAPPALLKLMIRTVLDVVSERSTATRTRRRPEAAA